LDKAKIDAQFSAGIQQVTEAYQNVRRMPVNATPISLNRESQLTGRIKTLEQENELLRKENQNLKETLLNIRSAVGLTEERNAYSRTDPRYHVPDPIEDGIGWVNPSEWGERG